MFLPYYTQFISISNILTHTCFYINTTSTSSDSTWIFVIKTIRISLRNVSASNFTCTLMISHITFIHYLILINLKILANLTLPSNLHFSNLFCVRYQTLIYFQFIIFRGIRCVITLLLPEACTFEALSDRRLAGLI